MHLLVICATESEARAIGRPPDTVVVAGGVGRTNAAATTTEAIVRRGPFDAVVSAGVAGALPGSDLAPGETLVASACVYAEEGLVTPTGFEDMESIGFALGDFAGTAVPVDPDLLEALAGDFPIGRIATVATCSGTDDAARLVAQRTGGRAEAMEGAAVVHAARRLHHPAIEIRTISNTTGDRPAQQWDLAAALTALGPSLVRAVDLVRSSGLGG